MSKAPFVIEIIQNGFMRFFFIHFIFIFIFIYSHFLSITKKKNIKKFRFWRQEHQNFEVILCSLFQDKEESLLSQKDGPSELQLLFVFSFYCDLIIIIIIVIVIDVMILLFHSFFFFSLFFYSWISQ